eukprot:6513749-Prymnesium_polylepis.1
MGLDDDTEWMITSAGKVRSTSPLQLAPAPPPSRARRSPARARPARCGEAQEGLSRAETCFLLAFAAHVG